MKRRIDPKLSELTITTAVRDAIGRARTLTPGELDPIATGGRHPEIRRMGFQLADTRWRR